MEILYLYIYIYGTAPFMKDFSRGPEFRELPNKRLGSGLLLLGQDLSGLGRLLGLDCSPSYVNKKQAPSSSCESAETPH